MSLFSDLNSDLRKEWRTAGPGKKILLSLSVLMTVSSLTSISDVVFRWRGFIADGVGLYHEYVREPLREVLSDPFSIDLSTGLADLLVLTLIGVVAHAKYAASTQNEMLGDSELRMDHLVLSFPLHFLVTAFLLLKVPEWVGSAVGSNGGWSRHVGRDVGRALYCVYVGWVLLQYLIVCRNVIRLRGQLESGDPELPDELRQMWEGVTFDLWLLIGRPAVAIAAVFILAAVNAGLSRPLS